MRPWHRLLLLATAAGLLLGASHADDQPRLEDAGWWWIFQDGPMELPAPETVPEGGLMVQGAFDDEAGAVAAVRYANAGGATRLELEVTDEDLVADEVAAILACPAADAWTGADEPGRWEDRPEADCEAGEVQGVRVGPMGVWRFDVGPLVEDGVLDIVLTPGGEPQAPDEFDGEMLLPGLDELEGVPTPPFAVSFDAPRDTSLEASAAGSVDDFDVPDPAGDVDALEPEGSETSDAAPQAGMDLGEAPPVDGGAPAAEAPRDAAPPQVADDAEPDVQAQPPAELEEQPPAQVAAGPAAFGQDPVRQIAALVAALCLLAAAAPWGAASAGPRGGVLSHLRRSQLVRPDVAAATLGGGASGEPEAEPRGVGRFSRPRSNEPPAL